MIRRHGKTPMPRHRHRIHIKYGITAGLNKRRAGDLTLPVDNQMQYHVADAVIACTRKRYRRHRHRHRYPCDRFSAVNNIGYRRRHGRRCMVRRDRSNPLLHALVHPMHYMRGKQAMHRHVTTRLQRRIITPTGLIAEPRRTSHAHTQREQTQRRCRAQSKHKKAPNRGA